MDTDSGDTTKHEDLVSHLKERECTYRMRSPEIAKRAQVSPSEGMSSMLMVDVDSQLDRMKRSRYPGSSVMANSPGLVDSFVD